MSDKTKKVVQDFGKRINGMNPDRTEPATQKQGRLKSITETIQTLRGK